MGEFDLLKAIEKGEIHEVEVAWADHQGYPRGKRIPSDVFVARLDKGIAFADAALTWDYTGDVLDGCRVSGWETGYPDFFVIPDVTTAKPLPWREGVAMVQGDVRDHHGHLVKYAPRSVLRNVVDRLEIGRAHV